MQDASSNNAATAAKVASDGVPLLGRLLLVTMGYTPFLHGLGCGVLLVWGATQAFEGRWGMLLGSFCLLYVLPPMVVRMISLWGAPECTHPLPSAPFYRWWWSMQWQMVFNRLPMLEELLRLIPGAYSTWLRLWGSKVGRFVYWSPGVRILDRQYVRVGHRVVFGAGARLNPHILNRDDLGRTALFVSEIEIGDDCLIGGYSLLPPSTQVPADTVTPGERVLLTYLRDRKPWRRHSPGEDSGRKSTP